MIRKLLLAAAVMTAAPAFARGPHRSEVSVAYGLAPVTDWVDSYCDVFTGLFTGSDCYLSGWGSVTAGYNFRLIGSLRVGAQVVYSSNRQKYRRTGAVVTGRYWSLMPNVKWGWLNLKIVSLYSRVGAGATFSRARSGGRSDSSTHFAFQVSPIGVEVGGCISAYAEAGIGTSGCLLAGVRYRF